MRPNFPIKNRLSQFGLSLPNYSWCLGIYSFSYPVLSFILIFSSVLVCFCGSHLINSKLLVLYFCQIRQAGQIMIWGFFSRVLEPGVSRTAKKSLNSLSAQPNLRVVARSENSACNKGWGYWPPLVDIGLPDLKKTEAKSLMS